MYSNPPAGMGGGSGGGSGGGEISSDLQENVPFEPLCHPMHSLICVPPMHCHALPCMIAQVGVDGRLIHTECGAAC